MVKDLPWSVRGDGSVTKSGDNLEDEELGDVPSGVPGLASDVDGAVHRCIQLYGM